MTYQFQIILNGAHHIDGKWKSLEMETDHIYLFDLKSEFPELSLGNEVLKEGENEVVIKCNFVNDKEYEDEGAASVKCIGVYAFNYETCNVEVDWNDAGSEIEEDED